MEVIVRIVKVNPWTGLTKWPTTFDYVGPYWTRSGNIYTGLSTEDARRLEKALMNCNICSLKVTNEQQMDQLI